VLGLQGWFIMPSGSFCFIMTQSEMKELCFFGFFCFWGFFWCYWGLNSSTLPLEPHPGPFYFRYFSNMPGASLASDPPIYNPPHCWDDWPMPPSPAFTC
jgi:hypothetical protein